MVAGGVLCGLAVFIERVALSFADVSLVAVPGHGLSAALAMILFCAPLEEAFKVLAIWPLYLNRRLVTGQVGALYSVLAACGFAAVEIVVTSASSGATFWTLLRVALAAPA